MRLFICCCLLLAGCVGVQAKELEGVMVQETVVVADGKELSLNGAGVRSKFFFDIYVIALYLEHQANTVDQVLAEDGRKRVTMHFLYKKVEREKLVGAWDEGFTGNTAADELKVLQPRIDQFNSQFRDAVAGDIIILDYVPGVGTKVLINNEEQGVTPGKDFNDALLRIWLGDKPVTKDLKKELLAGL